MNIKSQHAGNLPFLLYHEQLDTLSRKIASAAKIGMKAEDMSLKCYTRKVDIVRREKRR